jgi:hypothetical protein
MRLAPCHVLARKLGPSPFEARRKRAEHLRVTGKVQCSLKRSKGNITYPLQ